MKDCVAYEFHDGVATIVMDDGRANIMNMTMMNALSAAFDRAERDAATIVLRSNLTRVFSAGFDLNVFGAQDPERRVEMVRTGAELALRLLSYPYPTIACVAGHAFPMGAFLTLACDVRIGVAGAYRMGLNEVAIGIAPPSFAIELARSRLHPAWLSRTVVLGEMFEPRDGLVAGFLDQVIEAGDLDGAVEAVVGQIRTLHMPSHALAKQRLRQPLVRTMRRAIDEELTLAAFVGRAEPGARAGARALA